MRREIKTLIKLALIILATIIVYWSLYYSIHPTPFLRWMIQEGEVGKGIDETEIIKEN